jgi:hypothetical protein
MNVPIRSTLGLCTATLICALMAGPSVEAQVAGQNVNMVSGRKWPKGDPFLQRQVEPSMAVSTRNPMHILAGANDYRTVDLELVLSGGAETGDSWLGLFKSFDGGLTWQSTLLPGCPYSVPQCTDNGALGLGGRYQAAADPAVRAGTNGMFYYAGLAFDRATSPTTASPKSSIFVARYNDLNNNENTDPITYIDTHIVATGDSSQFLDKPALAVDIPRSGANTCSFDATEEGTGPGGGPLTVHQSFPAGNVYMAYTDFLTGDKTNSTPTHLMFSRSTDCGVTWSMPVQINTGNTTSQGSTIAVNPINGNVYVAWRQFAFGGASNAIMAAQSTNAGKSFGAPVQISTFQPFDQGTSGTSFRTNAYPSITTDFFGFVYVAFSARGLGPGGDARIVAAGSINGTQWTPAVVVDPAGQNSVTNPSGRGHQIMPAISSANGRLTILYYDLRYDHYANFYTPIPNSPGTYTATLTPQGELAPPTSDPSKVFTPYVDDFGLRMRRHTIDLRVLQLGIFPTLVLGPSVSVTQYDYGCCVNPGILDLEQFKFNVPNLPLFAQGTVPFLGDYIEVVPSPMFVPAGNGWAYNFMPSVNPLFHATWTDNRDVVAPSDGNWSNYTPPVPSGTTSIFQPGKTEPTCTPGNEGMRNQNIYTAQITGGLVVGAPGNAKPLGTTIFNGQTVPFQRAFAVVAQNVTNQPLTVRFTIVNQPPGGSASFLQFSQLTNLDFIIPAFSSVSRSVFVTSSNPLASVTVKVAQITGIGGSLVTNGLSSSTVINPDVTNPTVTNPTVTNPTVTNPTVTNFEVTNPTVTNPTVTNPTVTNPTVTNPTVTNPTVTNPAVTNVSPTNPTVTNPTVTNPTLPNPTVTNPAVTNPTVTNGSIQDLTSRITNVGNTFGTYTVKVGTRVLPPGGVLLQLILSKLYETPGAANCQLGVETHWVPVANITNPKLFTINDAQLGNPDITNPIPDEASITLGPGEIGYITIRVVNPTPSQTPFDPLTSVFPVTVAQAVDTQTVLSNTNPNVPPTPQVVIPLPVVGAVLNTNDSGLGSFRQAMLNANAQPGSQLVAIVFNIPGEGVRTITPQAPLPTLIHPTVLDATTQPGYAGTPVIELNGSSAGEAADGIHITAGSSTVRGFVINRFNGNGIRLDTNGGDVIQGNYVGTAASGTVAQGNGRNGIHIVDTAKNVVGGPVALVSGNVISGNAGEGVRIDGAPATGNVVQGNYIGTSASGSAAVGNSASGIYIRRSPSNSVIGNVVSGNLGFAGIAICGNVGYCGGGDIGTQGNNASGNVVQGNLVGRKPDGTAALGNNQRGVSIDGAPNTLVGGTTASARNVISFNGTVGVDIFNDGANGNKIQGNTIANNGSGTVPTSATQPNAAIFVEAGTGNTLRANSISGHTGLGIDLAPIGVNLNQPGGPHNFPVITSAHLANGTTTIVGTLNNAPGAAFTIEFFSNLSCNPSGNGEGAIFLASTNVGTDLSGNASVNFAVAGAAAGNVITATATDAGGSTSEFSGCMPVSSSPVGGLLYDNFNVSGVTQVSNGPPTPTTFVLTSPITITQLATYHWNNATGATPGAIGLQKLGGGFFGPYPAVGQPGQNQVPNAAWVATPNVLLQAGTYTVVDSDPSTWSYNTGAGGSGGEGFARVWGY